MPKNLSGFTIPPSPALPPPFTKGGKEILRCRSERHLLYRIKRNFAVILSASIYPPFSCKNLYNHKPKGHRCYIGVPFLYADISSCRRVFYTVMRQADGALLWGDISSYRHSHSCHSCRRMVYHRRSSHIRSSLMYSLCLLYFRLYCIRSC